MSEPMSEADLQFIRGEKNILERVRDHGGIPNRERADWILRLLAEVERLRTENAALREMLAEIVAAADATYVETHPYAGVGHTRVVGPFPETLTKARAILAEQPK